MRLQRLNHIHSCTFSLIFHCMEGKGKMIFKISIAAWVFAFSIPSFSAVVSPMATPFPTPVNGDPYYNGSLEEDGVAPKVFVNMDELIQQIEDLEYVDASETMTTSIRIPDYKIASAVLQVMIRDAMIDFFLSIQTIENEVITHLTRLRALSDSLGSHTEDPSMNTTLRESYDALLGQTKGVQEKIQGLYHRGLLGLQMANKYSQKNPEGIAMALRMCETVACASKITTDIEVWLSLVEEFNHEIDFKNFKNYSSGIETTSKRVATNLSVTTGMFRFAEQWVKIGLKPNQKYNVFGTAFKLLTDTVTTPVGLVAGLAAIPMAVGESIYNEFKKFFALEFASYSLDIQRCDEIETPESFLNSKVYPGLEAAKSRKIPVSFNEREFRQLRENAIYKASTLFGITRVEIEDYVSRDE